MNLVFLLLFAAITTFRQTGSCIAIEPSASPSEFDVEGGSGQLNVDSCTSVKTAPAWIRFPNGLKPIDKKIAFVADPTTLTTPRSGNIQLSTNKVVTVYQLGRCVASLVLNHGLWPAEGSTAGIVTVTSVDGGTCKYRASASAGVNVTTGNDWRQARFSVGKWELPTRRSLSIKLAGKSVGFQQAGAGQSCVTKAYFLSPPNGLFDAAPPLASQATINGTLRVESEWYCPYTLQSNSAWLNVPLSLFRGPASIPVSADRNTMSAPRSAIVSIAHYANLTSVPATQKPEVSCTNQKATPTEFAFAQGGGNGSLQIEPLNCNFAPSSNRPWIRIISTTIGPTARLVSP
jgi:hypothetical protein